MSLRSAVHAASGHRLGASQPRQEGPTDLRMVPPALAAWSAAALALGASPRSALVGAVTCVLGAAVLLLLAGVRPSGTNPRAAVAVAMALLCAATGAGSALLHAVDLHRGPVPDLAKRYEPATVEVTVTDDPRLARPRVQGDRRTPGAVVVSATATRIDARGSGQDAPATPADEPSTAHPTDVRTPVLLVVQPEDPAEWLALLPSTSLRVAGRLAPPQGSGRSSREVAAILRVSGDGPPTVLAPPATAQRLAGGLRTGLREATDALAPDARALLPGLVVGDTSRIPPDLDAAFRATDLTHLLAVSGANLTVLLMLLIGPPALASRAERRGLARLLGIPLRTTALLAALLTLAFVVVCRSEPSVLRAAVCGLITIVAIGTGRRRSLVPALATAVLLLVVWDPWLARDFGFLLSVLATGALLTFAPVWAAALRRRGVPGRLAEVLAATAAAQAVCAPVIVVLAAHVSLVAIPCNLVAELAVAPATVLGFAALLLAPFAMPAAQLLAWLAGWPAGWIAATARTGAGLPGADVDWPGGWGGALLLAVLTLLVVLASGRILRHPWLCAACAVLFLLAVVRPAPLERGLTGWPPDGWRVVACDVGQGDALVLAAGGAQAVVVDTGPEPEAVDQCLRILGVRTVPLVILTHFHADHVTGLPGVLRGRAVGAIQTTHVAEPPGQAAFVQRVAEDARVPLVTSSPGERRRLGALSWEVLWPPAAAESAGLGANDASVTLLVRTAGLSLFLPGDLEPEAQRRLLEKRPELSRVDVLKVAHHGSAHQEPALLDRLRPRLALISTGADNTYGHPAPSTVAALETRGTVVLRTDLHGALAVVADPTARGPTGVVQRRGRRRAVRGGRRALSGDHEGPGPLRADQATTPAPHRGRGSGRSPASGRWRGRGSGGSPAPRAVARSV